MSQTWAPKRPRVTPPPEHMQVNTFITSYHKDESGESLSTKHRTKSLTHQTGNYPVTCFVSRPSGITLVEFHSLQVIVKTNLLAELNTSLGGVPSCFSRQGGECCSADVSKRCVYGNIWSLSLRVSHLVWRKSGMKFHPGRCYLLI